MSGAGWELCARTNGIPFILLIVKKEGDDTTGYGYTNPTPVALPAQIVSFPITPAMGSFPWGISVFPD